MLDVKYYFGPKCFHFFVPYLPKNEASVFDARIFKRRIEFSWMMADLSQCVLHYFYPLLCFA